MREDPNDEWLDMMVLTRVTNHERGEWGSRQLICDSDSCWFVLIADQGIKAPSCKTNEDKRENETKKQTQWG